MNLQGVRLDFTSVTINRIEEHTFPTALQYLHQPELLTQLRRQLNECGITMLIFSMHLWERNENKTLNKLSLKIKTSCSI